MTFKIKFNKMKELKSRRAIRTGGGVNMSINTHTQKRKKSYNIQVHLETDTIDLSLG